MGSRLRLNLALAACLGAVLSVAGCRDDSQAPSGRPNTPALDSPEASALGPVDLIYICGNKFLVTNATARPVEVTYRVVGTDEMGSVSLLPSSGRDEGFSETELQTTERGVVELYQGEDRVARRQNHGLACGPSAVGGAMAVGAVGPAGQWTAPFPWANVAVHLSLLPDGKVLSFGLSGRPQVWDPVTGAFTSVPSPSQVFCAGHSYLPDGRLLVAGGNNHPTEPANGLPNINIFNPATRSWTASVAMRRGRWYPTTTMLANGDVVIMAGKDEIGGTVREIEVWSSGLLRVLSSAAMGFPLYPRTFLAPNGKIFYAGETSATKYLDPTGTGSWSPVATRKYGQRDYGAAVMYDDGKILYVGGGRTTNTAEIIDLNAAIPAWQWTGSMAFARRHLNATVLPTGDVLVTGGTSGITFSDERTPIRATELWNPTTGVWTTLASNTINRVYHATSILMPDGRVLHTGSGDAGTDQRNAELFSPPYLFLGPRPTITAAPVVVGYGTSFSVTTPEASSITKVSLIRIGSTTHAFDMNQRFQRLSFSRQAGALTVLAPNSPNRAPPGHYMLFILGTNGVPSVAKIIRLGGGAGPPPPPPPPPSSIALSVTGRTDATKQYMNVAWSAATGSRVDFYRNGVLLINIPNTGSYSDIRTFVGAATYEYKVCEAGNNVCSNQRTVWFSGRTPAPIQLDLTAWNDAAKRYLKLRWTGASGSTVDIYRTGQFLKNTPNTGSFANTFTYVGPGTYRYKVCLTGTTSCSAEAILRFGG
jgi:hypothetical protein